ncbi:MAG: ComF family protein [Woeseiaceae bacterium]
MAQHATWLGRLKASGLVPGAMCRCCGLPAASALCEACCNDFPMVHNTCVTCAARLAEAAPLCGHCLGSERYLSTLSAPYDYAFPLDKLLAQFKYQPDLSLLPALVVLLERAREKLPSAVDALIPVPLHWSRQYQRGFNQAQMLARQMARQTGLSMDAGLTKRIRKTPAQASLPQKARERNVRDAFQVSAAVRGMRVCIVDDVVTTGATMNALALALRAAGARDVTGFALARATGQV